MDSEERSINPGMVVLARESRGLTQRELAEKLAVTQSALSRIEGGLRGVSDDVLYRLSQVLGYPREFFFQTDHVYGFGTSELFHRRRRNVSQKRLHMIRAQINLRRMEFERMLLGVEIGAINIRAMDLDDYNGKPEEIARAIRAIWRLPEHEPIPNLTTAVESAGGVVIPFDFGTRQIDAISQWPPGMPPLIFVTLHGVGDRMRFTLAHELGHLIMHHEAADIDAESQADRFAAELLMPARHIRAHLVDLSLPKLAALKRYWKVSMAALLKRAHDLEAISPWQYRTLWMQIAKAGYKTREPEELDIPLEAPTLYREIIDTYRKELGYSADEFAKMLGRFEHEVRRLYFGPPRHLKIVS